MDAEKIYSVFVQCVESYHIEDNVDQDLKNPFDGGSLDHLLYDKCWIDTVQWHLEDLIRDPDISPEEALGIKRRIDKSNQNRTDIVEKIDTYFLDLFEKVELLPDAKINTETIAWAIDRLSILTLKIYHMNEEIQRKDASQQHRERCSLKFQVLNEQKKDLSTAINDLYKDMAAGRKYTKVYKQMKMYNDDTLNPVLYKNAKNTSV